MEDELTRLRQENEELRQRVKILEQKIDLLVRQIYGPSNEKIDPNQLELLELDSPGEPGKDEASAIDEFETAEAAPEKSKRTKNSKPRIPDNLPVIEEVIDPEPVQACPEAYRQIGEEVSDLLDYEPGHFLCRRTVRRKWVKIGDPESPPIIGQLPPRLIEGGMVAPGLLAHIVISKYADHLPLYRQEKIYSDRYDVELPRQTLCRWIEVAADWCQPIYRSMAEEMFLQSYVKIDETPIKYLRPGRGKAQQGYFWAYHAQNGDTIFDWQASRSHQCLENIIPDTFTGVIQCDGYGAYPAFARKRDGIQLAGCWAHARRKFHDALKQFPNEAGWVLRHIQLLYGIEQRLRQNRAGPDERRQVRHTESCSIIREIHKRLFRYRAEPKCLPKSLLGIAIDYCLGQWEALQVFLEDGRVEIDNNLVENAIRPTAVGKKNWLFIGDETAGWRSAVIYSLIVSCRHHGVEPFGYFREIFERLPSMTNHQIGQVTPRAFADRLVVAQEAA